MHITVVFVVPVVIACCSAAGCGFSDITGVGDIASTVPDVFEAHGALDAEVGTDLAVAEVGAKDASETVGPCAPVEWVTIPGGSFLMGAAFGGAYDTKPVHSVTVPGFMIGRTEVSVCQYQACVKAASCAALSAWKDCVQSGDDHAAICLPWTEAKAYCQWAGGRLCSESEWEYAARNGSKDNKYPWGDTSPTCDDAVFTDSWAGCTAASTAPGCSKPAGNNAWGVCDLGGNADEWVEDCFQDSYDGAPTDGTAREVCTSDGGIYRVIRGGCYRCAHGTMESYLRGTGAAPGPLGFPNDGARCCRSIP